MSFGYGVGDIIAVSRLAFKVYTACKDAPEDYRNISDEVKSLHIIINKAAQHFESTTLSNSCRQEGQEVLRGCQNVLEDLDSLIGKYNGLASASTSTSQVVQRVRLGAGLVLGTEDITTLRVRLISNTTLLNGFIQSCDSDEMRARFDNILGLRRRDSVVSLAGSINTKKAYKKLIKDLLTIGVTADMIEKEIKDIFSPQQMVDRNQMNDSTFGNQTQLPEESPLLQAQSQLLGVGDSSSAGTSTILVGNRPKSRSRFSWVRPPIDFLVGPRMLAAAEAGDTQRLISTLEYVRDVGFSDNQNMTALHKAAARGHKEIVQLLLAKGAAIEAMNSDNNTPLHLAASGDESSTVELLLAKGASIEALDSGNNTPLHYAAGRGYTNLDQVHSIQYYGDHFPRTVELLITNGASIEARNSENNTPLHLAALFAPASIVELLLTKGASVEATNNDNMTPLDLAESVGSSGTRGVPNKMILRKKKAT